MQFDWVIKKQHLKQRSGFQANPDLVIGLMKKKITHNLPLLFKLHEVWSVGSRENN